MFHASNFDQITLAKTKKYQYQQPPNPKSIVPWKPKINEKKNLSSHQLWTSKDGM